MSSHVVQGSDDADATTVHGRPFMGVEHEKGRAVRTVVFSRVVIFKYTSIGGLVVKDVEGLRDVEAQF